MSRILIHHHATIYQDPESGALFTTSFIGVWVNEISRHASKVGLLFHTSATRTAKQDTKITRANIVFESLGLPGNYTDKFTKNARIKEKCQQLSDQYDKLLIRGITPGQYLVYKNLKVEQVYYLLVGSLVSSKPKFSFTVTGLIQFLYFRKRLFEIRQIGKRAVMLANSPAVVTELSDTMGLKATYIATNTLSDKQIRPLRIWKKPNIVKLFFCGRVVRDKGLFELIEAFNNLLNMGIRCELSIAGEPSSQIIEEFKALSYWPEVSKHISFLGFVPFGDKLLDAYASHDIHVLPTYHEGFPHSIWESASTSTPVIVCSVGGIPGILSPNHAKLIEPRRAQDVLDAILETLNSEELTNQRIQKLYTLMQDNTLEKGVEQLVNLMHDTH